MRRSRGFTLIEILIAVIIIAVGLLGIAALQGHSSRAEMESYQRAQALVLVTDMVHRIDANSRDVKQCYGDFGAPGQAGTGQAGVYACNAFGSFTTQQIANNDMAQWHKLLLGSAEQRGTGAMISAFGCITYDGFDTMTVSVFWQGLSPTKDADLPAGCAAPAYGAGLRRGVSRSLRAPVLP